MSYIIDDDETRIQDIQIKLSALAIQSFASAVVGVNKSNRSTAVDSASGAAPNPFPLWLPIRNFGSIGNITLDILLDRVDGHVAKLTATGDIDFAFSNPPPTLKAMKFILDVTVDGTGGYTFNLPGNLEPGSITINNAANSRTILKIQTTDGGVTYQAQDILATGGGGSGYNTIQEEGSSVTQRSTMNFIGANVTAVDNPGQSRTDITIAATGSALLSNLTIDVDKDWNDKAITSLGGITMSGDINVNARNIIDIDQSRYVDSSGSVSSNTDSVILLNSSNQFQFNTAEANDFIFSFDDIAAIQFEHNVVNPGSPFRGLTIFSDSANTDSKSLLVLTRNFATGVTGKEIGKILFKSPSSVGGVSVEYAGITAKIEDATAGTIDGSLRFETTFNNATTTFMTINDGSSNQVKIFKQLDMVSNTIVNVGGIFTTSPTPDIGDNANFFDDLFINQIFFFGDVSLGYKIGGSVTDGFDFVVPTSAREFDFFFDGGTTASWIIRDTVIDAQGGRLEDLEEIQFDGLSVITPPSSVKRIGYNGNNFHVNMPTNGQFNFLFNGTQESFLTSSEFRAPNISTEAQMLWLDGGIPIPSTGAISRDGDDLFVSTTNGIKNFKDIGSGGADLSGIQDARLWKAQAQTVLDVWLANSKTGALTTNFSFINNALFYLPIYLGERIRISQIALEIKTGAVVNPSINFALYDSYPLENYPRTRLDTANDLPGAGFVGVVDTSNDIIQDLEPGLYWVGISSDVAIPVLAAFAEGDAVSVGYQRNTAGNDTFENVLGFTAAGTTFPATAASNMIVVKGSVTPAIFVETTFNPN